MLRIKSSISLESELKKSVSQLHVHKSKGLFVETE